MAKLNSTVVDVEEWLKEEEFTVDLNIQNNKDEEKEKELPTKRLETITLPLSLESSEKDLQLRSDLLKFFGTNGKIKRIMSQGEEEKDQFYEHLQATFTRYKNAGPTLVLGDMNARIGDAEITLDLEQDGEDTRG